MDAHILKMRLQIGEVDLELVVENLFEDLEQRTLFLINADNHVLGVYA